MTKAPANPPSSLGYALLGLIHQQPRAGYALAKVFTTTPMGHYSGSPGAIYPALRALERAAFVRGRVERGGTLRPKRVFSPTRKGLAELSRWLGQPVTGDDVIWRLDELMLRFAFMDQLLSRAQTLRFLESFRDAVDAYVAVLESHRAEMDSTSSLHGRLALESGIAGYQTLARWARHALGTLRRKRSAPTRKVRRS